MERDKEHFPPIEGVMGHLMDSSTSQLDDALNEKLEMAFHRPFSQLTMQDIAKIAAEYDPIDLAHAMTRLPSNSRMVVYDHLPDLDSKVIFMVHAGRHTRTAIFSHLDDREIKELFERMPPDEVVWLLDDMSDRRFKKVLEILEPLKVARIRELYDHDRHSAGRLMTNEFFAFDMNKTIEEVSHVIRDNPGIDLTRLFVLNAEGELIGFVPMRTLIVNPQDMPIRQVMLPILHQVHTTASEMRSLT